MHAIILKTSESNSSQTPDQHADRKLHMKYNENYSKYSFGSTLGKGRHGTNCYWRLWYLRRTIRNYGQWFLYTKIKNLNPTINKDLIYEFCRILKTIQEIDKLNIFDEISKEASVKFDELEFNLDKQLDEIWKKASVKEERIINKIKKEFDKNSVVLDLEFFGL